MSREQVVRAIIKHQTFFITTHRNPEADAMGSSLGLAHLLRQLGKSCTVVSYDPLPRILNFLPHEGLLKQQTRLTSWPEALFVLDCGDLERTGLFGKDAGYKMRDAGMASPVSSIQHPTSLIINIDHHITNKQFGQINWVDPEATATGELIYELIGALGQEPSHEVALCLYTAIVSETGFFAYSNTRPKTFRLAASLLERGVDPWAVAQRLRENTPERLKLLAEVLQGLERSKDGRLAWLTVTQELLEKTQTGAEDAEEFISFPRSLREVEVAILFREADPHTFKISLRSNHEVDVAKLAEQFGGGGHQKAAGCTMNGTLKEVQDKVLKAVQEAIAKSGSQQSMQSMNYEP